MINLKVGYIVGFTVIKALPGQNSYLCKLMDSQLLALLPKEFSKKEYRVGESSFASIYNMVGPRVTLSQTSAQYVRKVVEHLLSDVCAELKLKIKKNAWVTGSRYRKVAIESQNGVKNSRELYDVLKPHIKDINFKEYLSEELSFVKFSTDIKEYVINALCPPGDEEKIFKVIYHPELNKVDLIVDRATVGVLAGSRMSNLLMAKKLCGCEIELKPISSLTYQKYTGR